MIAANELRIGNWVSNGEKCYTVDANMLYDMATLEHYEMYPILLTPYILGKCGFDNFEPSSYYRLNRWFELRLVEGVVFEYDLYRSRVVQVIHLHHLQNLYFALSGEELTITL